MQKYKITTCASVNATGGTLNIEEHNLYSASDGIDGGTGCNCIFSDKIQVHRQIYMLYDYSNDYHLRISIV